MQGFREDDIANFLTGLGGAKYGRSGASRLRPRPSLTSAELDTVWEQRGLGAKVSEIPADDMVREGFEIEDAEGVETKDIESLLEDVGASELLRELCWQGSHYGGALLIAAVDDGVPPSEPLDFRKIQSVEGFAVLDRHAVTPLRLSHGPPEGYMILNRDVDIPGEILLGHSVIHESRVIKYNGPVTPTKRRSASLDYWGSPVLDRVWLELRSIWTSLGYAEELLHDMSVDVFSIPGLHELVKAGNSEFVRKRVRMGARLKSILRALILDGGNKEVGRPPEELRQQGRSVTGVSDVLQQFLPAFVAGGRIPESILMGRKLIGGGLNDGSNSGEHRAWESVIRALQRTKGTPWINWILEILFAAKDGITGGVTPASWTIKWNDLSSPSEAEQATTYKTRAEGDRIYSVDIGAASSQEVRDTRFVERSTGPLQVEGDLPDLDEDDEPEPVPPELEETSMASAPGGI